MTPIQIDDAYILPGSYRNFAGNPTKFNRDGGDRSFCIRLNPEAAEWFKDNNFNVQERVNPNDPDLGPTYVLSVKVNFSYRPPTIVMISGNRGTTLTEETVSLLDTADIQKADVAINPRDYIKRDGTPGRTAYCLSLYATIAENPYAEKYRNLIMSGRSDVEEGLPFN